jgi:hypothetical protein
MLDMDKGTKEFHESISWKTPPIPFIWSINKIDQSGTSGERNGADWLAVIQSNRKNKNENVRYGQRNFTKVFLESKNNRHTHTHIHTFSNLRFDLASK